MEGIFNGVGVGVFEEIVSGMSHGPAYGKGRKFLLLDDERGIIWNIGRFTLKISVTDRH